MLSELASGNDNIVVVVGNKSIVKQVSEKRPISSDQFVVGYRVQVLVIDQHCGCTYPWSESFLLDVKKAHFHVDHWESVFFSITCIDLCLSHVSDGCIAWVLEHF